MKGGVLLVVAGALLDADGRFLLHKRPEGKAHAGLWEFPGGKVEPGETTVNALVRELHEELGVTIAPSDCQPAAFAEGPFEGDAASIVIQLYTITQWGGDPLALEGGELGWFEPEQITGLAKPPLDVLLAQQLVGQG